MGKYSREGKMIRIAKILCTVAALSAIPAGVQAEDFLLSGAEQKDVTTDYDYGWLYDYSGARILPGGSVNYLHVLDTSTVDMSGGSVYWFQAYESSTVDISGGNVEYLYALDTSTAGISGGIMKSVYALNSSTVEISGGSVDILWAWDSSAITFLGKDFVLGNGLSLIDNELFGIGILSGQWLDGTYWTTEIGYIDTNATVLLIPEPATLLLFALGGLGLLGKRR